ncbi:MAG: hypothetical protein ACTSR2_01600 [Candidatus Hodarchaeales archaeon]
MEISLALISVIIGAALLAIGLFRGYRTADTKRIMTIISVFLLGLGLLAMYGNVPALQSLNQPFAIPGLTAAPAPTTTTTVTKPVTISCAESTATITVKAHNMYSKGTALSDASTLAHRVFIDGSEYGYVSDGGSFTGPVGAKARIIIGANSTAEYKKEITFTIPCGGTVIDEGLAPYDNSPTVTFWLEDGSVMSSSNAQDMTTDSTYTLPFRIRASSKKAAGSPYHPGKGNIFCVQANNTVFDKFEVVGAEVAKVPRALAAAAGKEEWCYYVQPVDNNEYIDLDLVVDTAGVEPTTVHNATYYLYDVDLDLNADTLETIIDVEDEDFNDLGYTTTAYIATGTIYVK